MPSGKYPRSYKLDILGFENEILKVEEFSHYKDKNSYWKIRSKYDNSIHIISRKKLKESNFNPRCCINKKKKDDSAFNTLFHCYKAKAKERNLLFDLTKEEFKQYTQNNCHYCNNPPNNKFKQTAGTGGLYVYNGIDRIDNLKGYTKLNSVSCCGKCNH